MADQYPLLFHIKYKGKIQSAIFLNQTSSSEFIYS